MENINDLKALIEELNEKFSSQKSTLDRMNNVVKKIIAEKDAQLQEEPTLEPISESAPVELQPAVESEEVPVTEETVETHAEEAENSLPVEESTSLNAPENEINLVMPNGMPAEEEIELKEEPKLTMPTVESPILSETLPSVEAPSVPLEEPVDNTLVESSLPVEEKEENEKLQQVTGFGQSPEKISEIKGYFNSEELKAIINGYENTTPIVEEHKEEKEEPSVEMPTLDNSEMLSSAVKDDEYSAPSLTMPSGNESVEVPHEEAPGTGEYVGHDGVAYTAPTLPETTTTVVETPKEEVVESNPEAVAENLANNFGDKERMLSIEEMLKNMEQDFDQGKVR